MLSRFSISIWKSPDLRPTLTISWPAPANAFSTSSPIVPFAPIKIIFINTPFSFLISGFIYSVHFRGPIRQQCRPFSAERGSSTMERYFESMLCSEHTVDRSAHLFQDKSRRDATHHFELIRLTWTNFKSIGLHSLDGDFNHVFHLHDRNAFHVFRIKGIQEFGLCRRRC